MYTYITLPFSRQNSTRERQSIEGLIMVFYHNTGKVIDENIFSFSFPSGHKSIYLNKQKQKKKKKKKNVIFVSFFLFPSLEAIRRQNDWHNLLSNTQCQQSSVRKSL
jgi:hypothetical protein